MFNKVQYIIG